MKKTIAAILLSALLILVCAFALSACNPSAELTGNWIGYLCGDSTVQVYLSAAKNGNVVITERRTEFFDSHIRELTRKGMMTKWMFSDLKIFGAFDNAVNVRSYSNEPLNYETDEGKFVFKRTELSLSEWRQQAFTFAYDDSKLPNEVFPVYKPLYYDGYDYDLHSALIQRNVFESMAGKICFGYGKLRVNLNDWDLDAGTETVENSLRLDDIYFIEVQISEDTDSVFDITLTRARLESIDDGSDFKASEVETVRSSVYYDSTQKKLFTGNNLIFGNGDTAVSLCGDVILGKRSEFEIRRENMTDDEFIAFFRTELSKQDVQDFTDGKVSFQEFFDRLWHSNKT